MDHLLPRFSPRLLQQADDGLIEAQPSPRAFFLTAFATPAAGFSVMAFMDTPV
jgi:hypothetical protein